MIGTSSASRRTGKVPRRRHHWNRHPGPPYAPRPMLEFEGKSYRLKEAVVRMALAAESS